MLDIKYPVILAPMFLVTNEIMVIEALNAGITAAIPALNYRTTNELEHAILFIKSKTDKPFGINLIVNKLNPRFKPYLEVILKYRVAFIITSLGNPKIVINACKPLGIKVFCDVVDLQYAKKVECLGADGLIAVNNQAGGHAGPLSPSELLSQLHQHCNIPVISAGGVANHQQYIEMLNLNANGLSIGTPFIACCESNVCNAYKEAIVQFKAKDIVTTNKLSGSPLRVINTPYVQKTGTQATYFEKLLINHRILKKYVKIFILKRGFKTIRNASFNSTYKTVWVAGPGIEHVNSIRPLKDIIYDIVGHEQ